MGDDIDSKCHEPEGEWHQRGPHNLQRPQATGGFFSLKSLTQYKDKKVEVYGPRQKSARYVWKVCVEK